MNNDPAKKEPAEFEKRLAQRVDALEMVVTHLERTIQDLDETIRAQNKQLDVYERKLAMLTLDVGVLREGPAEVRSPEEEKPPHY